MKTRLILLVFVLPVSCAPVSVYRNLPRVQAWEPATAQFEELDRTTPYPDDAVLFAGSSSIRLWASLAADPRGESKDPRILCGARASVLHCDRR